MYTAVVYENIAKVTESIAKIFMKQTGKLYENTKLHNRYRVPVVQQLYTIAFKKHLWKHFNCLQNFYISTVLRNLYSTHCVAKYLKLIWKCF